MISGSSWMQDGGFTLLGELPWITVERFVIRMAIGLATYFA